VGSWNEIERWVMAMLSGGKSQEEVGGGEVASDYTTVGLVTISFFRMSNWKKNFSGEAHVRTQGGQKIYIGTEKERLPGGASEGRSNRAKYPMTKVQLGAEVLG